ncbi:hypothetical protein GCM10009840_02480 [Pseudolysinimonas kribbensis]|uniref:FAD-dependent oxidoreductase n=1 Tax=Pseudolysinimonas kribbensis TaxID=433641 RepID=A0ABQ6K265_9MICO|nr:FAD-dependent oxidoreductase [Pseudolysinimonas kribbensis]GMA94538.1 hypothetical protein GCM10025881_13620 [Pseudolysinimonas kribbensis]
MTRVRQAEVAVFGATAGGVCAAVAAAEHGARVLLLEPGAHVGGMTSGGLGYTDVGDLRVLGGAAARFRNAVAEHYGVAPGRYAGPEPQVAEAILLAWLDAAGVELVTGALLTGVAMRGDAIASASFRDLTVEAGVWIDAGYEGDLLAAAGVPYRVGREDRALHGERFAGRREVVPGMHSMPDGVSPFRDDAAGLEPGVLLPQVRAEPMADVGAGDGGVMSYGYRLCLSTASDRIPFDEPAGYDPARWELGRRILAAERARGVERPAGRMVGLEPNLPGGKADGNSLGPFSLSVLDGSAWRYPDADQPERDGIREHHRRHALGLLHFLRTDPAVPPDVRSEIDRWGLAADEFADTGHLPHQLYVREARRMQGRRILTEHDLLGGTVSDDTIALGSYHLDVREVQRAWRWVYEHPRPIAQVVSEGYYSVPVPVYGIPYAALLPPDGVATNLLVSTCVSASHVAFSSIRMEVQYQMLGQAAGTAAALAIAADVAPDRIDVGTLRETLAADGAVLAL